MKNATSCLTLCQTTKFWRSPNSKHLQCDKLDVYICDSNETKELFFKALGNSVSNEENAGYQFTSTSPFPTIFSKVFYVRCFKRQDSMVKSLNQSLSLSLSIAFLWIQLNKIKLS